MYAEDALPPGERDEVQAHLRGCATCAGELESARAFLASLAQLPRFEPSVAFTEAVMARVAVRPEGSLALARVRRWLPVTRRGWMGLWAMLLAPLAPLVAVAAWLLSQPLVTAGGLWSMGQKWTGEAAGTLFAAAAGTVAGSGIIQWGQGLAEALWSNPFGTATLVAVFMALATPVSAWSLVRLLRTPMGGVSHAN
ncbi:MAG TPA: zf-HC2 domain-containing protein [Longimicrobiaceae bacterium]